MINAVNPDGPERKSPRRSGAARIKTARNCDWRPTSNHLVRREAEAGASSTAGVASPTNVAPIVELISASGNDPLYVEQSSGAGPAHAPWCRLIACRSDGAFFSLVTNAVEDDVVVSFIQECAHVVSDTHLRAGRPDARLTDLRPRERIRRLKRSCYKATRPASQIRTPSNYICRAADKRE